MKQKFEIHLKKNLLKEKEFKKGLSVEDIEEAIFTYFPLLSFNDLKVKKIK